MNSLKNYISKQLDEIILEDDKSKKSPSIVANKLKSLGVPAKTVKKAVQRMKDMGAKDVEETPRDEDLFPGRIHSDDDIKNVITIRKLFKNKSPKFVDENLKNQKDIFINHYDNLFSNGASELPGILELYSLFRTKRIQPNLGGGYIFKMIPEDAKSYAKEIIKYFLVKNSNIFPINKRAKMALDSYVELLEISKVDRSYIENFKKFYYNKYNLNNLK
jgi:hypothetical protein